MSNFTREFVNELSRILGESSGALHEPDISSAERESVIACLDSGFVSSAGELSARFEEKLSDFTGSPHVVATNSGTSALHLALKVAGVGQGDEVLVPPLTFVATASAIVQAGGVPHFVDVDPTDLGISPTSLRAHLEASCRVTPRGLINRNTGNRVAAIIPVHIFGHIGQIEEIIEIANEFDLQVLEDSAEALGSFAGIKHAGTISKIGILSFNGNKIVTSGAGGAILTSSQTIATAARHLGSTAKIPHQWKISHDDFGFNYRMPNINAALGLAQLSKIHASLRGKRQLLTAYDALAAGFPQVSILKEPPKRQSNYWLHAVLLTESEVKNREPILTYAHSLGLQLRPAWTLIPHLRPYANFPRASLENAESVQPRIINLPSGPLTRSSNPRADKF